MSRRRILSLWFPRMGAERLIRLGQATADDAPFAVLRDTGQMQVLWSLSTAASHAGLVPDQPLRDAMAMCPSLVTRLRSPHAEAAFLMALRRWAGVFSPWVADVPPNGLVLDITGCAHLFGGEEGMVAHITAQAVSLGLSVEVGLADTVGAAWALARFAGHEEARLRSGDAIDQEARATRSRAAKRRHWERGGAAPRVTATVQSAPRIAPSGQLHAVLAPLPIAALRVEDDTVTQLARLGLRRIGDLIGMPRAALARRFGRNLVRRLDQALGQEPEPVSPARPPLNFAVRLTLPEPIGLVDDIIAGLDRLLPALQARLKEKGRGARRVRLDCLRVDQGRESVEVGLARPSHDPDRIKPLLMLKLADIDAGFGIDAIRLEAVVTEPVHDQQVRGHLAATEAAQKMAQSGHAVDDLIGRLGTRVGMERITRIQPADSHIPEKSTRLLAAAWSQPWSQAWPDPQRPRPLLIWRPEPVHAPDHARMPQTFRLRGRDRRVRTARGPERLAPEWWLDDPDWRSGVRDYWHVICEDGEALWLYYAHGGAMSSGWFCHGSFA
ncbi:DNA polymerase Y family protein [Celeribacter arenosi]|uniref:DNA polymerase Y family protein n=1 Tax=Celeribacter arenosi TaxID=792649 RepID=A0ABP7JZ58_9RHOB